jgi:hypothetical protein
VNGTISSVVGIVHSDVLFDGLTMPRAKRL